MLNSVHQAQDIAPLQQPLSMLIVDDDEVDRQRYLRFLRDDRRLQFSVVEAATAEEGVRKFHSGQFDCVVLDYDLPGTDGLSVFRSFLENTSAAARTPVVMLTGHGCESVAVEALQLGVADYLIKDELTASAFRRATTRAVEKSRLQVTLREQNLRLQEVNTELNRQAVELQRFYHTVSHEIKTPLAAVREFVTLLRDGINGPALPPAQREFVEHAIDGCDQISRQVNDLLDSARLSSGKLQLRPESMDISRVINFAVASVERMLAARMVTLKIDIAPGLPTTWGDAGRIAQVIGNLLNNAGKFSLPGGEITISARLIAGAPDHLDIAVKDNGCGIASEHLDRIFDRLYQVPTAGDYETSNGLGLGLSIARELVLQHGGRLTVESTENVGSTFRVSLPIVAQAQGAVRSEAA